MARVARAPDYAALVARHGSPLLLLDCAAVRRQYRALRAALPGVDLYYALKPLPHPAVVAELRDLGGSFDVATSGEIRLVKAAGVPPGRCIHTHPIKTDAEIRAALRFGIRRFVVDNPDEIRKFAPHRRRAELLLRLSFRDPTAVVDLSRKFGCEPAAVAPLLELARSLGIRVRGLSFHVGSQVREPKKYVEAIGVCSELFAQAAAQGLARLDLLDIGGGFPIGYRGKVPPIRQFCAPIRAALKRLPAGVQVIAEPGRFIAGPAGTAVSTVVGRAQREGRWWYYLDDGLYGSYNGQLFDHALYPIEVPGRSGPPRRSVLAGPTCDSIDVVREDVPLPELQIGDLVVGRLMGAYTACSATDFNFIPRAKIIPLNASTDGNHAD
jgi:ornithine decarboxylase